MSGPFANDNDAMKMANEDLQEKVEMLINPKTEPAAQIRDPFRDAAKQNADTSPATLHAPAPAGF